MAEVQRLEKVLQDAGIKLTSVASEVLSKTGRAIVDALIAGENDPAALADLAKGRLRDKVSQLTEALAGRFEGHHVVAARQILDHIDFLDAAIGTLGEQVTARIGPFQSALALLMEVPGISRLTAEVVIAETGGDMSRFPAPDNSPPGRACVPATTSRRASGGRYQPLPGIAGCDARSSRQPAERPEPRAATSELSTARSPGVEAPTRQPSPSLTASSTSSGTCSPPKSTTRILATTGSSPDATPNVRPAASSASSRSSGTPSR